MQRAIAETNRRREKQIGFNKERGIIPRGVSKKIKDIIDGVYDQEEVARELMVAEEHARFEAMSEKDLAREIKKLEKEMVLLLMDMKDMLTTVSRSSFVIRLCWVIPRFTV